ncbi:hypothetical protein F511_35070 [Dorcoceras hygrometricum]|uniref:Uncharacterized protein n=1 Tax=Dorcoceras hygrometricum TaxID=472368 RepID=A0A2Z7DA54_9LAMI|nr:hypothetical protein F511_35070 [Dorcoceras hygrometricum]
MRRLAPAAVRRRRDPVIGLVSITVLRRFRPWKNTSALLVQTDGGLLFPVVDLIRRIYRRLPLKCWFPCETGRSQAPRRQQADCSKPRRDEKKRPDHRNNKNKKEKNAYQKGRTEKAMVAEENKSSWADSDSEESSSGASSSSDSEDEVQCLMVDDTEELSESFKKFKAEEESCATSTELADSSAIQAALSKLENENAELKNRVFRQLPCWRLGAWLRPVSRGNRHFTVGGGRLRQSGPRPEGRLLRQSALEGLTRSAQTETPRKVGRNKFRRRRRKAAVIWERREACAFRVRVKCNQESTILIKASKFSATEVPFKISGKKRELLFEYHLLHDIVAKSLCAKAGSFDSVTCEKFEFMVAISAGIIVNWGKILFQRLLGMVQNPKKQSQGYIVPVSMLMEILVKDDLGTSIKLHAKKILNSKQVENYIKTNQSIAPEGETNQRTEDTASNIEGGASQNSQPIQPLDATETNVPNPKKRKQQGGGRKKQTKTVANLCRDTLANVHRTLSSSIVDGRQLRLKCEICVDRTKFVVIVAQRLKSLNDLSTQVSSLDLSYARLRDDMVITKHHTAKLHDQLKTLADGLDIKIDVLERTLTQRMVDDLAVVKYQLAAIVEGLKETGAAKKGESGPSSRREGQAAAGRVHMVEEEEEEAIIRVIPATYLDIQIGFKS